MAIKVDPRAKALIFDIDGTLADTMEIHYQAWLEFGRNNGFDYPRDLFFELAGIPTKKIIGILNERLGCNLDPVKTIQEKEDAFLKLIHQVKPITPVAEIAKEYHGKLPMALGTGGRKDIARLTMEVIGMESYFDIMVAAEDVERHKPEPDTFLKCAELMGVEPQFCQVFEDAEQGLEAGRRAGMIVTDVRLYL